jgi:hypothetical protein
MITRNLRAKAHPIGLEIPITYSFELVVAA